jgi:uncharacterized cupin superfamily protein
LKFLGLMPWPHEWMRLEHPVSGPTYASVHEAGASRDGRMRCGTWSYQGPGEFTWAYGVDEWVHITSGSASLSEDGRTWRTVYAGESLLFHRGDMVDWRVPASVQKMWVTSDRGGLLRTLIDRVKEIFS